MDREGAHRSAVEKQAMLFGGAVVLGVFALDQLSKLAITRHLRLGEAIEIIPHLLSLRHVENPAFAFRTLAKLDAELLVAPLILVPMILTIALVALLRNRRVGPALLLPGALILGGASSNLADRIARGVVIDFLQYHSGARRVSVYNLADLAIFAGMLVLALLFAQALLRASPAAGRKQSEPSL